RNCWFPRYRAGMDMPDTSWRELRPSVIPAPVMTEITSLRYCWRVGTAPFGLMEGTAMVRRVSSELLLVGSLPSDSTEGALRSAAGFFGDLVFALPDGETGPRAGWVSYEREKLVRPNG